ncbi:chorismate synthase [Desulfuromonas acetoxidans]|uniref:Chorismate synthase n=1 Tax=Desulfuromonas acetoxidans (strain DSM 684 / 11070) TaxID=281689 RepID=Q1JVS7_DESA6|nr:chorismate synthase [Desulfuromonas acetoxidans]EAT14359.1 Chorismate synthase [Desulfuromonas acetoxidans DSM 684]MBF0644574.1 chorismate synthase [Desulfuromonas acetoxidans]NVD23899.1 chorismate synthase [Desulfuromonas acetoxidans]NVE16196.1 chorismate synthase [Desulfuromonas acetoxidans]
MSSSFGTLFKVTTFGESHCPAVGAIVDGVPPRMTLTEADIQVQLDRRRPGQNKLGTDRDEADQVKLLSGVEFGKTLGSPIGLMVANKDQRPGDYGSMSQIPRPSHADYTYRAKYGTHASSGGGRSSARETIGRVAAGAIAEKFLLEEYGIEIVSWVSSVGAVDATGVDMETLTRQQVDGCDVRCPDAVAAEQMTAEILAAREAKDSVGGVLSCVCRNVPAGWGEPAFDRLEALMAHAMLSLPASKGFEIGSGFAGARQRGSVHNDPFVMKNGRLGTETNRSGGVQGGISNGEPVYFRVAFKPPATIGQEQQTVDFDGNPAVLAAKGRHDPCVVARAVPIVETMAALVLADLALIQRMRA